MEEEFFSDGKNRFMRIPAPESGAEAYKIRMMNMNHPESLLHLHMSYEGTKACYDYNVTGLVSLKDSTEIPLQQEFLYSIVFGMEHLSDILREHLLSEEELNLDPEAIFLQMDTGRVFFCYMPGVKAPLGDSLRKLMEHFMKTMNPEKEEDVLLLYGLYQKSREPQLSLTSLSGYWRENRGKCGFSRNTEVIEDALDAQTVENYGQEENEIVYRDLGLTTTKAGGLFAEWQEKQGKRAAPFPKHIPENTESESVPKYTLEPAESSPISKKNEKESGANRLLQKIKEYSFEIAIGVIVLVGVLILLFTNR